MPPKRKAAGGSAAKAGGKKAKIEPEPVARIYHSHHIYSTKQTAGRTRAGKLQPVTPTPAKIPAGRGRGRGKAAGKIVKAEPKAAPAAVGRGRGRGRAAAKIKVEPEPTPPPKLKAVSSFLRAEIKGKGDAASPAKKTTGKGKAVKTEEPETVMDAIEKLKTVDTGKKKKFKPDQNLPPHVRDYSQVLDDYDCMLNQTNIGRNNNKYYVCQVLKHNSGQFYTWFRWGRVGLVRSKKLVGPTDEDDATKQFERKFKDKTKNEWANRADFQPVLRKYTLLEMAGEEEDEVDAGPSFSMEGKTVAPSKLDQPTQELMKLIFNDDMFKEAMKKFDLDVKKMPLGKISKAQIAKGFDCLDEIESVVKGKTKANLIELSSKFYTLIPHSFGMKVPPAIRELEAVRMKMDMLLVLADIELAQSLQRDKTKLAAGVDVIPHPMDINYGLLSCKLEHVDKKSKEYKIIEKYTDATSGGGYRQPKIQHVWKVARDGEDGRFKPHDGLKNRKLLWHGTNVAVVTAILKGGLRIMPHSGGRVGKGIYFASENSKSAAYVRTSGTKGIMFLNEVALGKESDLLRDDSSLTTAPSGYDSIVARGWTEPDPKFNTTIKLDGKDVIVPQSAPVKQPSYSGISSFRQSEYLVYKESQNRIRFLLLMDF